MTGMIGTLERQQHPMQTTAQTSALGAPTLTPESERLFRPLGWLATLARSVRHQWDPDVSAASMQALEMMTRCSTKTRR